ncbi:hypothetical protein B0H11DRAFT_1275995 [Mycena galericulata]|nr:hypothetical protein B0H11DRAFT_1275995 [Mycena galericulata]
MVARISAIGLELEAIAVKRTLLKQGPHDVEIAQLDMEKQAQERILSEAALRRYQDIRHGESLTIELEAEVEAQEAILKDARHRLDEIYIRKLHLILSGTPAEAKKAQQELEDLDVQQAALEEERVFCGHIITADAFRFSPIRWIPDDILTEIFVSAKAGEPECVGTGIAPLVTQVCARWRNVACGHPRLWSSFTFSLFGKEGTAELLRTTLNRCRAAALSVTVDTCEVEGGLCGTQNIALLSEHAQNIVNLRFRCTGNIPDLPILDVLRDRLPRLEVLGFSHLFRGVADAFEHAPRLRTLELGRSSDLLELKCRLPSRQLQSLRLSASTSGYHLASLLNLTSMVSIQTERSPPVMVLRRPPALSGLTTWRVQFGKLRESDATSYGLPGPPSNTSVNFFARFRTPALITLHVCRLTSVDGLMELLVRSGSPLATLVLEEPAIGADDLLRLLTHTPHLQTLEILSGQPDALDNGFFKALTPLHDLLPCLMQFRVDGSYHFGTDSLLAMLESRMSMGLSVGMRLSKAQITLRDRLISAHRVRFLAGIDGINITGRQDLVKNDAADAH